MKAIKVTAVKQNLSDSWPGLVNYGAMQATEAELNANGVQWYYPESQKIHYSLFNTILTITAYYVFDSDTLWGNYKNTAYTKLPIWKPNFSEADLLAYYEANNITVTFEEVTDPDLTGYIHDLYWTNSDPDWLAKEAEYLSA